MRAKIGNLSLYLNASSKLFYGGNGVTRSKNNLRTIGADIFPNFFDGRPRGYIDLHVHLPGVLFCFLSLIVLY